MTSTTERVFAETGGLLLRALGVLRLVVTGAFDRRETLRLVDEGLRDVAPTVAVGSVVIGGIVGLQGLGYLTRYAATDVFGWAAAMSAFRDVGPTLLAFALAARLGTRNAAETAVLAARERLDAICALGLDPARLVTAPRVLALVVISLALYPPAALVMLVVAFLFAAVLGGQSVVISAWSVIEYVEADILLEGLVRMSLFGLTVGLATTHAGLSLWLSDRRGAGDVGAAVYGGSVVSACGIVTVNLIASLFGGAG
jgi:phospholipid/cholesterol/gamma-HCH transport system permease protein